MSTPQKQSPQDETSRGMSSTLQSFGEQSAQNINPTRLQIFGDPHFSNYSCSEVPSLPILSSQNEQTVGTTISLTSASSIPLVPFPQAGESSFLPAAPKGFVRIPSGSGPAVINTHGGPSLMLPLESAPVCKGGSNIPRIPHSYLGASVDSMPHAPPMIAAPPIRGLATDTEGKIQLHLLGTGNLPSPPLLLDPGDIQLPPPQDTVVPDVPQLDVWFQHVTSDGRSYYSHSQTKKTIWERPANARIVIQSPPETSSETACAADVHSLAPTSAFLPQQVRYWSQHQTPEGKVYYYNNLMKQSVWEKPVNLDEYVPAPKNFGKSLEALHTDLQGGLVAKTDVSNKLEDKQEAAQKEKEEHLQPSCKLFEVNVSMEDSLPICQVPEPTVSRESGPLVTSPSCLPGQPVMVAQLPLPKPPIHCLPPTVQPILSEAVEPKGPRPVRSIAIAGTPWSVVWSSDDRQFFFNATNRNSVWTIPEDLECNPLVTKILEETTVGKKRIHKLTPASEAKRLKLDNEEDEDDYDDVMDKDNRQGFIEENLEVGAVAPTLIGDKCAQLVASKSLDERQKEFKQMLLERGVSAFSTWEKELPKFVFDQRCKLLNVKERKTCFEEYVMSRAEEERREKRSKLQEKREKFRILLKEAKLNPKSTFSDFAFKYGKDIRFRSVEKMREREQLFTDYLSELKKVVKLKEQMTTKSMENVIKVNYMTMLGESEAVTECSHWKKVKVLFCHDPRYKAVESSTQREAWFREHVSSIFNKVNYDKQERVQASLKEREREVKLSRTAHEKEWSRERDQLRKSEALQHFKALLVDMVRNADKSWHDAKRNLRRDHRWELAELLETDEKEKLFQHHIERLMEKKRINYRQLLEETTQISLTMPWKKARKLIKDDARYKNYGDTDNRRELEYDEYLKDRLVEAKNDFRTLLRETKTITYKSYVMIKESDKHHKDITDVLKNDNRYLCLECIADERNEILQGYIEDLHHMGPPPPPTATNPSERLKRLVA